MKLNATLFTNDAAMIVAVDAMEIVGKEGVFYVHMEGSGRGCYKLAHDYKEELLPEDIYFLVKDAKFFKNHMSLVDEEKEIYRWEWNKE